MSSSRLQFQTVKALDQLFGCSAVKENVRPDWLVSSTGTRLELDVFVPQAKIAVEVQGAQHYRFTPHFHGSEDGFTRQVESDAAKRMVCRRRGISLFEVASKDDLNELLARLQNVTLPPDPRHLEREKRKIKRRHSSNFKLYAKQRLPALTRRCRNAQRRLARAIAKGAGEKAIVQLTLEAENTKNNLAEATKRLRDEFNKSTSSRLCVLKS